MFHKFALLFSTLLVTCGAFAQLPCGTDDHYHMLLKQYPQLAEYEKQFNTQMGSALGRSTSAASDTAVYDVPLVVHVIHDYGSENIADNAIYDAVAYWASVYVKQNPDTATVLAPFIPYIGNAKLRLHLATIDPNGNPTKGIVRHKSYLTFNADDQAKLDQWPNHNYINIWFINKFGSAMTGAAAYAIYPSSADYTPFYDGVISLASYVNYAKVIPHELGHVLNLSHTWGSTNNPEVACGDDGVDDTPPTKGHNPVGCTAGALYDVACALGNLRHYAGVGGADSVVDYPDTANSENIMDYTYCQKMFTKGQAYRMRQAITSPVGGRSNLITAANLAATGALAPMPDLPPIADYTMNKASGAGIITDTRSQFLSIGNVASFVFHNTSWNDTLSAVTWEFSNGASTATSTSSTTVTNQFSVPGWITVTLTATSNAGSSTLVNATEAYAADTTAINALNYYQNFSSGSDLSRWPMFNYYKNQFRWEVYNTAGMDDNSCIRYRSFDTSSRITGTAAGDHDDIYTPAFNMAGIYDKFYLNFYTSGASTNNGGGGFTDPVDDSLEVDVSITGGTRWIKLGVVKGADLANYGDMATEYEPARGAEWVGHAINIPVNYRTNNSFFRFRYWPGNTGNNLYMDNLYFYPYPVGIEESLLATNNSFNVFPNPASNGCTLVFKTGTDGLVSYAISDIMGKKVFETSNVYAANSIVQESLPRSVTPLAGMYFITTTIDGINSTRKLVVY